MSYLGDQRGTRLALRREAKRRKLVMSGDRGLIDGSGQVTDAAKVSHEPSNVTKATAQVDISTLSASSVPSWAEFWACYHVVADVNCPARSPLAPYYSREEINDHLKLQRQILHELRNRQ